MGALAAPAMMMLTQLPSAASAPFFVWGPTAIAAGLLMWLLPDTLGASVPEYVQVNYQDGRTSLKCVARLSETLQLADCCFPLTVLIF